MPNSEPYDKVTTILAELQDEGYTTPDESTVRRWARNRRIGAQRFGLGGKLLVSREDVRALVIPAYVEVVRPA